MLQARRLGNELLVGIHSDEEILENKGPTVMTLAERYVEDPHAPLIFEMQRAA
jgi:glycerol-3-phosphate cytidylyltransferase-like family protein